MWFPLICLSVLAIIASSFGFSIENAGPQCPPPKDLKPCTCSNSVDVTALCENLKDRHALTDAFAKHPNWNIQRVHIDHCVVDYIPSSILTYGSLKQVNVSSSTLVSLFDEAAVKTKEIDIFLYDVKILRGLQWKILKNSSISGLGTFNFEIKNIGKDFKEYMPQSIKNLWFENAKTARITDQAFQRMVNLDILTISGGSLKKLSRDMFPKPWNIKFLNFNQQKLTELPAGFFDGMPQLTMFSIMKNSLTTVDEKVFTKGLASYYLKDNPIYCGCSVKWITTSGKKSFKRFIGKCVDPEPLQGKDMKVLKEEDFNFCQ